MHHLFFCFVLFSFVLQKTLVERFSGHLVVTSIGNKKVTEAESFYPHVGDQRYIVVTAHVYGINCNV